MNFKSTKNKCYTYFSIHGNYNVKELCRLLDIQTLDFWQAGEKTSDGIIRDESYLSCNKCEIYNVFTSKQMEKTIEPFRNKIDLLVELKKKYDLKYYLVIVPYLYAGEVSPALAPNADIVDFCYKTGTDIDIDLYIE